MFLNHGKQAHRAGEGRRGGKGRSDGKTVRAGLGVACFPIFRAKSWPASWEGADGRKERLKYIPEDAPGTHSLGCRA